MADKVISWNLPMLKRFKIFYQNAVELKADTFVFEGNEYVVGYAKYLIEYLDGKFKQAERPERNHGNKW